MKRHVDINFVSLCIRLRIANQVTVMGLGGLVELFAVDACKPSDRVVMMRRFQLGRRAGRLHAGPTCGAVRTSLSWQRFCFREQIEVGNVKEEKQDGGGCWGARCGDTR
jgi:hypothetical protein